MNKTKQSHPTAEDKANVVRIELSGLVHNAEIAEIAQRLASFHPRNWTYPGEVLLGLAADALMWSGASRERPIDFSDIREQYLPELNVSSKNDHYKSKWALRAAAMIHAGVDPGILEETAHWYQDDLWQWSHDAAVVFVRAAARYREVETADAARSLAAVHELELIEFDAWTNGLPLLPTWMRSSTSE